MNNMINISIDDVSPHPLSSTTVLRQCYKIISKFPEAKFTLFVPISYWRTMRPNIATENPLQIDLFPDFCDELRSLPKENFEICYHGFYHGIPGKSDNDEFQYFSEDEATKRFEVMFEIAKRANLDQVFKPIFRPPAWRMSPGAIRAARKLGIEVLALSPKDYAKATYQGEDEKLKDVVFYNCNPPLDALKLYGKTEIVYHACEWDRNYLSDEMTLDLIDFLSKCKEKKFVFIKEMLREN